MFLKGNEIYVSKLTELSSPRVRSIKKKMIAQNVDPGRVAIAMGYASNTNPGPGK